MRKLIFTLFVFTITLTLAAQTNTGTSSRKNGWKSGGMLSVNIGQGGSRNWAAGSERFTLQGAAALNYWATRDWRKNLWETTVDLSYAVINTNSLGVRKTDDKIDIVSMVRHGVGKNKVVGLGAWFNMRTQFHDGFDHKETPKKRISGIMAPGYLTLAPGFDIRTAKSCWSLFVSPAASRLIVFTNRPYSFNYQGGVKPDGTQEIPLAWHYGVDPERKVRYDLGFLASAKIQGDIAKNVSYKTRVDAFSNYLDDPQNIDVFWNNSIHMKVNKWLMVSYQFDLIYDDDVRLFGPLHNESATQLRSQLGVGVAAKL